MNIVLEFKDAHAGVEWADLELWKMDLKGAFTLLSFKASNCQLIATELEGGVALFFLCGIFGWTATPITATPIAFAVVSRAILHEMEERTGAACDMFVDEALAASLIEEAASDIATTCGIIENLTGDGSVAHDKTGYTTEQLHVIVTHLDTACWRQR